VPFFPHPDHWGSGNSFDRMEPRGRNYHSFGGRDERERPHWTPGQGKNPDLEAEVMTGVPLARIYSEHDDRRGGGGEPSTRRRGSSPGGAWRHDLFEDMAKK